MKKKIELSLLPSGKYKVTKLTNTTSPTVGSFINKEAVEALIAEDETTVVIAEAKRRGVRRDF